MGKNTESIVRALINKGPLLVWYIKEDEAGHLFASRNDAARFCADRFGDASADKTIYGKNVETYEW